MRTWPAAFLFLTLAACKDGPGKVDSKGPTTVDNPCEETLWYEDKDEDGFGSPDAIPLKECESPGPGFAANPDDCDDGNTSINPDKIEVCDADDLDEDCNGFADENDGAGQPWYTDSDADGYGSNDSPSFGCDAPADTSDVGGDCDDEDPAFNPGVEELCTDALDLNCDGASAYADADGDGAAACEDCDDNSGLASPYGRESCDGIDNNCDGQTDEGAFDAELWYSDADSDGYGDDATGERLCSAPSGAVTKGHDCNDADATIHPLAEEDCASGVDNNCDGSVGDADDDGDGKVACEDCNDGDAGVFEPGTEVCDGIDNDCDLDTDEADASDPTTWYLDADGDGIGDASLTLEGCTPTDGYVALGDDCDDTDASIGSPTRYYTDLDGDGYGDILSELPSCAELAGYITVGEDCGDTDAGISPDAEEVCDGIDNNCDGETDGADATGAPTWYADLDGDGQGDPSATTAACEAPPGYVDNADDCDDEDVSVYTGAVETCNLGDDDCDGTIDNDATDPGTYYYDGDGDGAGDDGVFAQGCSQPEGYVPDSGDCDDSNADIGPTAVELCDGGAVDDDCDGSYDDDDAGLADGTFHYTDGDTDGYGDAADIGRYWCAPPASGTADNNLDCDDLSADISPSADESCDGVDNNCDGTTDEDSAVDAPTWFPDLDLDGYGDTDSALVTCYQPTGYLADGSDCDDSAADIYPGADEYCNFIDDDCEGVVDNDYALDAEFWYADTDRDGYGDVTNVSVACDVPAAHVADDTDCDDSDEDINPGVMELCDDSVVDEDCDGRWDDEDDNLDPTSLSTFYADTDGDGFGDVFATANTCQAPAGYLGDSADCDDTNEDINPDAEEVCDEANADEDCNGASDDDDPTVAIGTFGSWYDDVDGDGFGDPESSSLACDAPPGMLDDDNDCDDSDSLVNPSATEICLDLVDNDCDGRALGCGLARNQVSTSFYSRFYGVDASDEAGVSVDPAGDFNGDGNIDIIIGATGADDGGANSGAAYIVYGLAAGDTELNSAGVTFIGEAGSDDAGISVAAVGDTNNDGYDDVMVGATGVDDGGAVTSGSAYLVLGNRSGRIDLSAANVQFRGATAADQAGKAVDGRLDFDDDGVIDLVVGAWKAEGGGTARGEIYVVASSVRASSGIEVDLDVEADLILRGVANTDNAGSTVSFVPDHDGDGLNDLFIGVPDADTGTDEAGAAYLVFGGTTGTVTLSSADVVIWGNTNSDRFGTSVSAGDVDGDGYGDLAVGSPRDDDSASDAGTVAVFLSSTTFMYASEADSVIAGAAGQDVLGTSVDMSTDVDGDSVTDLVVGAPANDTGASNAGSVYILLGPPETGLVSATDAQGRISGTVVNGAAGTSVAGLGDASGDGYSDLLFGAPVDNTGGTAAGAVYVFTGSGQ